MKRLEDYSAEGLASIGRTAFWHAIAGACPDITSGDMAPGEDLAFERESEAVVETWLRNNVPDDEPQRWTLVIEGPEVPVDEGMVAFAALHETPAPGAPIMARVVEVHHEDMLERGGPAPERLDDDTRVPGEFG